MKTIRIFLKGILIPLVFVVILAGEAVAYPSVSTGDAELKFFKECSVCTSIILTAAYPATISDTSAGAGDPLVGSRQVLWIPSHSTNFDYRLVAETSPGSNIWTLATSKYDTSQNNPLNIFIGSEWGGTPYITASVVAETIDFNTGVLNFGPVIDLQTFNEGALGSAVLDEFSQFATGTFSFEFATSQQLANWVRNPRRDYWMTTTYQTTLSAVPEPEVWALMLVGFGLIGFSLYRKQTAGEPVR